MKARHGLAVLVVVAAVAAVAMTWMARQAGEHGTDEKQIRALLRELEQDLNRGWLIEIFNHLTSGRDDPDHERREHVLMHSLKELSAVEELHFSAVEIVVSGGRAMVETTVIGFEKSSHGARQSVSRRILLRLVKESGSWKIAGKLPEGAIHAIHPLRRRVQEGQKRGGGETGSGPR